MANQEQPTNPKPQYSYYWVYGILLVGILFLLISPFQANMTEISANKFYQTLLPSGDVDKVVVVNRELVEVYIKPDKLNGENYKDIPENQFSGINKGPHYYFTIGSVETFEKNFSEIQKANSISPPIGIVYDNNRTDWRAGFIGYLIPILLLLGLWIFFFRRIGSGMGGAGGQIFNIGKSRATLFDKDLHVNVTFDDVAGLEEAKEEVMEVVDFLKNPKKYTALGGKIPKGCLLVGPPGTGKTLIAKAMAGEAKVPFFSISGSDFVEMFVGVGASRVRDLFKQAREKAPCIIFIDEIDAIGRARGRNVVQGNDERENTLNQLLVEMDGFSSDKGVIIIAATNRPDVLDSALLRPGRFDRLISVDKPDLKAREKIFSVHLKPIKISTDVEAEKLAAQTPGFVGADIANVCNEAALIAARKGKKKVEMKDFQDAIDRSIGGLEKKNKIISPDEREVIAYHEAGHAICGWYLEHAHPLLKVTIVPRGVAALGYAQYLPKEQYLYTYDQLLDEICMTLGGRAAEDIIFGRISTGAQNDLERITKMAYAMVAYYGMNKNVGNVSFYDGQNEYNFQKPYSDETAKLIDEEVRILIEKAYERTKKLLNERKEELMTIGKQLLEKEILYKADLEVLIGKRPFDEHPPQEPASNLVENKTPTLSPTEPTDSSDNEESE
ncbi:MAG: ATP-dependent zinc metalloprotease FtsH [Chitinophagales bacterium]|nr:ATP-dependent zinc metalloprotease FtsH [Bacteroidota bacterium]MCB9042315.1 ATP-dependent metallopeptidase FtsH/Yme1/Tma family protein [Chitinophagales bacterium]